MRNLKLTLAYDGTDFHGWQRQPGLRTVQGAVEDALAEITQETATVTASGRTDSGVHALGQVAHVLTASRLACDVLRRGLNALMPADVRVLDVADAPQAFHATLDAVAKRYRYEIDNRPVADPFRRRYAWHIPKPLDHQAMHRAGQALVGRHDFRCFETEWPNRTSSVRTIHALDVFRLSDTLNIEVEADGFLYNMVRAITGTLMLVGAGKRPEGWVREVVESQTRTQAGPNAPPQGLVMLWVKYETGRKPSSPAEGPALP